MPGVSNSSPLLYLALLGDLRILPRLFGPIGIPEAVWNELVIDGRGKPGAVAVEEASGEWLTVHSVSDRDAVRRLAASRIELGEAEAILLAEQLRERVVFMDDETGVRIARSRGLLAVQTPAIYIAAKQQRLIRSVRPKLDQLRRSGFRLRQAHYELILRGAGELEA